MNKDVGNFLDDAFFGNLFLIVVLVIAGKWLLARIIHRVLSRMDGIRKDDPSFRERARTLGAVISATGNTIIYLLAFFMLLNTFGVDIGPVLAAAGIIGIAVSFGSQALVKDFISGLLVLLEDQYRLGERVRIAGLEGTVRKITLRTTLLEGDNKELHYVPNGTVGAVTNISRQQG